MIDERRRIVRLITELLLKQILETGSSELLFCSQAFNDFLKLDIIPPAQDRCLIIGQRVCFRLPVIRKCDTSYDGHEPFFVLHTDPVWRFLPFFLSSLE